MQGTLATVAALVALSGVAAQEAQRFTIAIARSDGGLVPFATYDAGRWERAWPEADEAVEGATLDAVPSVWRRRGEPVPDSWRVWSGSSDVSRQARVTGVTDAEAVCSSHLTLTTDLPVANPGQPFNAGVAIDAASLSIDHVEEVARSDAMWAAAEELLALRFPALEAARAAEAGQQLPRETPLPAPRMLALYRPRGSSPAPLYFAAERRYRTSRVPQDAECGVVTMMTGWLIPTDTGELRLVQPEVFLTDCDAKEVRAARPLGVLPLSGQRFWILEEHGYEDWRFRLVRIVGTAITYVIDMYGGGC